MSTSMFIVVPMVVANSNAGSPPLKTGSGRILVILVRYSVFQTTTDTPHIGEIHGNKVANVKGECNPRLVTLSRTSAVVENELESPNPPRPRF